MKEFIIKNYKNEVTKVNVDLTNVKYIFKLTVSGDEVLFIVNNNNFVSYNDSSSERRFLSFYDGLCMLYPSFINFGGINGT